MKGWGCIGLALSAGLLFSSCGSSDPDPVVVTGPRPAPVSPEPEISAPNRGGTPPPTTPGKTYAQITAIDLATLFPLVEDDRVLFVDVRPGFFYVLNHIPGAISLPLKSFEGSFAKQKATLDAAVAAKKVIVLYCADEDCPDGRDTARLLGKKGYSTSIFEAGWEGWKASGL